MNATSAAIAGTAAETAKEKVSSGKWFFVFAIVVAAGILSGFYAVNDYASGTGAIVKSANNNSARFEAIFRDIKFVAPIARKVFIAAVTRQRNRHEFARHLRNVIRRHSRGIREGFVVVPGQFLDHGNGIVTRYGHILDGGILVSAGQSVGVGNQIARVGSTGNSTGNHLHFEVLINGSHTDPASFMADQGISLG